VTDDAIILEQIMTGTVIGSMLGLPGNGRSISFRMLHVFEFRDDLISRENIWLDSAAIIDQLS
jgi:predicted ester cyclase